MSITHEPWPSAKSPDGVAGQRIAIVGYSHYLGESEVDRPSLTNEVVEWVVSGEKQFRFFKSIQGYFGFDRAPDFWNRTHFFNFVPDAIGSKDEKYKTGSPEQLERGRERVLRILGEQKIDKVFVFTIKGWCAFPPTLEESSGRLCTPLLLGKRSPNWGTYDSDGHRTLVCGFRHPQFATGENMKEQVTAFLNLSPNATCGRRG